MDYLAEDNMSWLRSKQMTQVDAPQEEQLGDVLREVRSVEVRPARLLTDVLSGGYRSTFRGMGVEFSDVREYSEGDDPRSVDWNVTARMGRPFVKRFVEERERTLIFLLDLSPSMAHGLGAWALRQAVARYCAMLGLVAIDNHDRVGMVANSPSGLRYVVPQAGGGHVLRVVRDAVTLPCGGGPALGELIATVNARVKRRAVVFVFSDFFTPGYEHALRLSARHHDVVAVRMLPRELTDPPRRLLRVLAPRSADDSSSMRLCDFTNESFRAAWFARVEAWRQQHDDLIGRARIEGLDVEIPAQADVRLLAQPLLDFFRRRRGREAGR
jgi:uncharacterized protein (DUF58 family)